MKLLAPIRLVPSCCLAVLAVAASPGQAENWPQWRGPHNNGVSGETGIAVRWSRSRNVAWRRPLPGPAGATPVVWNDRIFLTSADGDDLLLLCFSTDGRQRWRRRVASGNRRVRNDEANYASPSPLTDGQHVWVLMGTGDLACYDFDGNRIWHLNLQDRYGPIDIQYGLTSTPVLYGDRLYLQVIHGPMLAPGEPAYVVALEKRTGKEVWKKARQTNARFECKHSYASPVIYDDGQRQFLITHGADYAVAYRLADGRELWRCGGLNPFPPVPGRAGATRSSGGMVRRLDANKDGKVSRSEVPAAYRPFYDRLIKRHRLDPAKTYPVAELEKMLGLSGSRRPARPGPGEGSYHPTLRFVSSPAVAPGLIVVPSAKRGPVLALRADLSGDVTGSDQARLWLRPRGTPDVPSPLICLGLVYLCSEYGILTCLDARTGQEYYTQTIHRVRHRASPVYADGHVYLTARDGKITVIKAGRQFQVLAQNDLEEPITASPVISNGTLYLRTFEALWAIRDQDGER